MFRRTLIAALVAGLVTTGYAVHQSAEAADAAVNLQVLPKDMPKDQVKKVMKEVAKSLGQQCDFCHDTEDFSKDTNKHKLIARDMMRMTAKINKENFKGKPRVSCMTCHNGNKEPKK